MLIYLVSPISFALVQLMRCNKQQRRALVRPFAQPHKHGLQPMGLKLPNRRRRKHGLKNVYLWRVLTLP
ncbi:hypothetical protein SGRA_3368 [Saprospira grandis str. Lewin]|uniref:Uncharacterized protein n=1 Tax=Saprospira grandis (strain Lewin) TaxID=984262 RepID=H6L159_SAPGL|nr:hypothetical protein SGRA_3368 [Saprospira grandis str. Lewin]